MSRRIESTSAPSILLLLLVRITQSWPRATLNSLGPYFRLLATYFQVEDVQPAAVELLKMAVLTPLEAGGTSDSKFLLDYPSVP